MKSINQVTLLGTVGKDAEFRAKDSFKTSNFNLATSESYMTKEGDKVEKTTWHRIVSFGYLAEYSEKWIKKGCRVCVTGKIQNREYEENGAKKFISEIIADQILFLSEPQNKEQKPTTQESTQVKPQQTESEDEDLPF